MRSWGTEEDELHHRSTISENASQMSAKDSYNETINNFCKTMQYTCWTWLLKENNLDLLKKLAK